MTKPDDATLVWRSGKGDAGAFDVLVKRYQERLFQVAFRMTQNIESAENIVLTVFTKVSDNLFAFDASREFTRWVYRLTVEESLKVLERSPLSATPEIIVEAPTANGVTESSRTVQSKSITLINQEIDGVNSAEEHVELKALTAQNPAALKYSNELEARAQGVDGDVTIELSPDFHGRVMGHVSLDRYVSSRRRSAADQLWDVLKPWLTPRVVFAFFFGLVTGFALFLIFTQSS